MADRAGTYALTLRYSNEEQAKATHYNPDPLARIARIAVNGGEPMLVSVPHSFNANNWWEMTVPVTLKAGANTIRIAGEEQPNWDGRTYASQSWPAFCSARVSLPISTGSLSRPCPDGSPAKAGGQALVCRRRRAKASNSALAAGQMSDITFDTIGGTEASHANGREAG